MDLYKFSGSKRNRRNFVAGFVDNKSQPAVFMDIAARNACFLESRVDCMVVDDQTVCS